MTHEIVDRLAKTLWTFDKDLLPSPEVDSMWEDMGGPEPTDERVQYEDYAREVLDTIGVTELLESIDAVWYLHKPYKVYQVLADGHFATDAFGDRIVITTLCSECTPDETLEYLGDNEWTEDLDSVYYPCHTIGLFNGVEE